MAACDPRSAAQPHEACPEEVPAEPALFPRGHLPAPYLALTVVGLVSLVSRPTCGSDI